MTAKTNISRQLLIKAINTTHEGIVVIDAQQGGFPQLYVNEGYERMTGYPATEMIGKKFRVFHASDDHQSELAVIRSALTEGDGCVATMRNYRKDGSMYWNEISVVPVRDDDGKLTHFISIQKDVSDRIRLERQLDTLSNTDPVSGVNNRHHFEERFSNLLSIAKRIHCELSVLLIDLDYFKLFNDRYGQAAGDECLRKVGECIAKSFRRTSDCVARYDGEAFAVVSFSSNLEGLHQHTKLLCERVRTLNIPHQDSPHGVVTVSIGGVQRMSDRDTSREGLIEQANLKLLAAKRNGCNCVNILD
ncbi:MAG TPA: diguanylate cyclase [Gallionella sp.]|nr:diguanylate cyclase [Gallionella sp.]